MKGNKDKQLKFNQLADLKRRGKKDRVRDFSWSPF